MSQDNEENPLSFNEDLVKKYPRSNRRLSLNVARYGINAEMGPEEALTVHISPYGIQFRVTEEYEEGQLLKIHINMPDYWERKQRFVDYSRIDTPSNFKILAKVVSTEDVGKRGKKKIVLARTVNMDEIDEQVLKAFLQEG
ncbi:PilZ domain-containing protein [Oligoflexus tunisiensis]|uniref:PilZ domain-containing protein n=1 Tax=Oligoflexus tunisiensis TaxID=708132 RepID=UPI00114C9974|nr:PilZ domain-containing protein [Oligoflexus tunisiensis]